MSVRPYTTRFESGEVDLRFSDDGRVSVMPPPVEVLYPGEQAEFEIDCDLDEGVARFTVTVQPAPGIGAKLLRLRYRVTHWKEFR